ncbi:MAG: methylenetetrahydrofolate reductase [Desulfobacterales bacterium]|nr:methylenetetrahydrofolate reductase [Desulfobacterales bacterium]
MYAKKAPVVSMEFFPPRDEAAAEKFEGVVDTLAERKPDYKAVTFGAGGSNRDGSCQTVKKLMDEKQHPTVAYIAGYGLGPEEITDVLDKYKDLGVETVFVIRGDPPRDENFVPHPESFSYACDLIAFIRDRYDFTLGCAGYPEGHIEAESLEKDIEALKKKQDAGAEYVVAQFCYDNQFFYDYEQKCRQAGITIPIIPGIMPVYTVKLINILSRVCGATITPELQQKLDALNGADKDTVLQTGIDFAVEQCRDLLQNNVTGLHFYTMNRSKSTCAIIDRLRNENLL